MIDFNYLAERVDNDLDVMNELLEVFLTEFQRILAELQTSSTPSRQAHSLKGMSRELGATPLAELSHQLEQDSNVTQWLPELQKAFPVIEQEIHQWQTNSLLNKT